MRGGGWEATGVFLGNYDSNTEDLQSSEGNVWKALGFKNVCKRIERGFGGLFFGGGKVAT